MGIDILELTRLQNLDKEHNRLKELYQNQAAELATLKEEVKKLKVNSEFMEELKLVISKHGWYKDDY